jgi:hypothetical protein
VSGRIYDEGTFAAGQPRKASIETRVTLSSDSITRAQASTGGVFSFTDLQPGTYTLTIDVPDGFTGPNHAEFTIQDPHACVDRSFVFKRRGGDHSTR